MVGAARAQEGKSVLTITEKGYGKRTPVEEYRITNRGGLGIKNYQITEKTGKIVGVKVVDGSEDLLLVTQSGILIRTPVENIKETANRATQGRHCHALQGGGRSGHLHGAGRPRGHGRAGFRHTCGGNGVCCPGRGFPSGKLICLLNHEKDRRTGHLAGSSVFENNSEKISQWIFLSRLIAPLQQIIQRNIEVVGNPNQFINAGFPFAVFIAADGILAHGKFNSQALL